MAGSRTSNSIRINPNTGQIYNQDTPVTASSSTSGGIVTPTIGSTGIDASEITSGTLSILRLGMGVPEDGTFLANNNTWQRAVKFVDLKVPLDLYTVTGGPVTGTGTFNLQTNKQAPSTFWAGPILPMPLNGTGRPLVPPDVPTFRALDQSDIPYLDTSRINSGVFDPARLGLGMDSADVTKYLRGDNTWQTAVTSVNITVPTDLMNISGGPVEKQGTFAITLPARSANNVFAGPTTGSDASPVFRLLVPSDIPVLDTTKITTGIMATARLGNGTANGYTFLSGDQTYKTAVTSVDVVVPAELLTTAGGPVLESGVITLALQNKAANIVFAGPTAGNAAAPTFRALVSNDIPVLDTSKITSGTMDLARIGTGTPDTTKYLRGDNAWTTAVSSVAATVPSDLLAVSGTPITTSGTLAFTLPGRAKNLIFAGPSTGSDATPSFRSLVADDIPVLDTSKITTGTMELARIGTGTADTTKYLRGDNAWTTAVSSIDVAVPAELLTTAGGPVTTSGTVTLALATKAKNLVFAGPSTGSDAAPAFRTLVQDDIPMLDASKINGGVLDPSRIPNLDASKITTGTMELARIGTGTADTTKYLRGDNAWTTAVSSIDFTVPGEILTYSGGPVTTNGTVTFSVPSKNANVVYAGPTAGTAGVPNFRALVQDDIPVLDASKITTGTMAPARLGSGTADSTTFLSGDETYKTAVTNIGIVVPSFMGATAAITTSGNITLSYNNQAKNLFFTGPVSGSDAAPAFRGLDIADINAIGTGLVKTALLGTGTADSSKYLRGDGTWDSPSGNGTVTKVEMTVPSVLTVSGTPITSSGTFFLDLAEQSANIIFAGPASGSGTAKPTFRTMAMADINAITSGTILVERLGTGTADSTKFLRGDGEWSTAVTSVGVTVPTDIFVAGSAVTTSGNVNFDVAVQEANRVWAAPATGNPAKPAFRALVSDDIPVLDTGKITTGVFGAARLAADPTKANANTFLAGDQSYKTAVQSINLAVPSYMNVTGGPVTQSGTIAIAYNTQSRNKVFCGPTSGSEAAPNWRSLVQDDIPGLDAGKITAGLMNVARLGTGSANTTTFLRGDNTWNTAITSIDIDVPSDLLAVSSSTGFPITQTSTVNFTLPKRAKNIVFAGPNTGNDDTPAFRALVADDIPVLDTSKITTGVMNTARLGTNGTGSDTTLFLRNDSKWQTAVTSIGVAVPAELLTTAGGPITTSGTVTLALATKAKNKLFIGPVTGSNAAPTFRNLDAADINALTNGPVAPTVMGTGTANALTFLRGDNTWNPVVTSVTVPDFMAATSVDTTTDNITFSYNTQSKNKFFASPTTGSDAAPTFRILDIADVNSITTGIINTSLLGSSGTGSDTTLFLRNDSKWQTAVTSIDVAVPTELLTTSGGPVTTSGTVTLALATKAKNIVFAGPSTGSDAAPAFRALVSDDIPVLDTSKITTGIMDPLRLGPANNSDTTFLRGDSTWQTAVTSISITAPDFMTTNSPITTSGTFDLTLKNQDVATILMGPVNGSAATPSFRALQNSDLPVIDGSKVGIGLVAPERLATNINSSVKFLRGDSTWQDAVQSVKLAVPSFMSAPETIVTGEDSSTNTINVTFNTQSVGKLLIGPSTGSDASPTFRRLVAADISNVDGPSITTGTINTARMGSGTANAFTFLRGDNSWTPAVASITVPSFMSATSVSNSTNNVSITYNNASANTLLLGPTSGSSTSPTFRVLDVVDINAASTTTSTKVINTALLGTGTAASNTFLSGNNTWVVPTYTITSEYNGGTTYTTGLLNFKGNVKVTNVGGTTSEVDITFPNPDAPFFMTQDSNSATIKINNFTMANIKLPTSITASSVTSVQVMPIFASTATPYGVTRPGKVVITPSGSEIAGGALSYTGATNAVSGGSWTGNNLTFSTYAVANNLECIGVTVQVIYGTSMYTIQMGTAF